MSKISVFATCLLVCGIMSAANFAHAADVDPVESAGKGLRKAADFPWYDANTDGLQRLEVRPEGPVPKRFDWVWGDSNWNPNFSFLGRLFEILAWLLLIGLVAALIYLMVRAYLNRESANFSASGDRAALREAVSDQQRIENLPFPVRNPKSDLLGAARERYEAGDFAEAIIYVFSYQLLQLDKANLIRLAKGKTNRQYLREVSTNRGIRGLLTQSMLVFEDVFFGHYPLHRDRFESCWNRLDEFHQLLQESQ